MSANPVEVPHCCVARDAEAERADAAEQLALLHAARLDEMQKTIRRLEGELSLAKAAATHRALHGDLKAAILEFALTNLENLIFVDGAEPVRAWTLWENERFGELAKHFVSITSGGVIPRMQCPACTDEWCEGCQGYNVAEPVLPKRLAELIKEARRG